MPPLVVVAVNITLVPAQIELPGPAAMLTDGVTVPDTVIVIAFDVAVAGLTQVAVEVITQVTASLFINDEF